MQETTTTVVDYPSGTHVPIRPFIKSPELTLSGTGTIKMFAVLRGDINMSAGKCCSQAGHVYVNSCLLTQIHYPDLCAEYQGTKVCLESAGLDDLLLAHKKLWYAGIPCDLMIDSNVPSFYGGHPCVTALGVGPIHDSIAKKYLRKFKLKQ